jgi:hypothetical protein
MKEILCFKAVPWHIYLRLTSIVVDKQQMEIQNCHPDPNVSKADFLNFEITIGDSGNARLYRSFISKIGLDDYIVKPPGGIAKVYLMPVGDASISPENLTPIFELSDVRLGKIIPPVSIEELKQQLEYFIEQEDYLKCAEIKKSD